MEQVVVKLLVFLLICTCLTKGFDGLQEEDFVDISPFPTVFETTSLPHDAAGNFLSRYMASVGNGHVATTVYTDSVFMNGLYNGFKGESHRARIPSRNNIRLNVSTPVTNHTFALDVEKGTFFERLSTAGYKIELKTYAHRYFHKVIVSQIHIEPITQETESSAYLEIKLTSDIGNSSTDIIFEPEVEYKTFLPATFQCGKTLQMEDPYYQQSNPTVCVIASKIPSTIHVMGQSTFTYFAAYDVDLTGAAADYDAVAALISEGHHDQVFSSHVKAWEKVWNTGRIEVEGNVKLAKVVYGAFHYILSSLPVTTNTNSPVGQFYGLSPGGLAYGTYLNDYQGHSFWDTETWMFPPILYFFPEAAQEILNYRLYALRAARDRAKETGYLGARFPWESCFTGREVTPDCCPETRDLQIHVTGDISFAVRQYISATRDKEWLEVTQPKYLSNGCGLVREIAQFWVSRAVFNASTGYYDINGVMPPDEDHHDVNNSVYTNVVAAYAIFFAKYLECLCGKSMEPIPEDWVTLARSLKLLYDDKLNYHPEFEGYTPGTTIKQADVVLLGFPLLYNMEPETRKNDLEIYENVTRETGPAMTWAMHTVGFLELDETDKAESLFNRSYQSYMREPFKIWTESQPPTMGAINFITGMGGFLQSVISGYAGLRLHLEKLVFLKPRLPPDSEGLRLIGLHYLENILDIYIEKEMITIAITTASRKFPVVAEMEDGTQIPFVHGKATIDTTSGPVIFRVRTKTLTSCPLPNYEIGIPSRYREVILNNKVHYVPV